MNYRRLTALMNDLKLLKCEKCNLPLDFYKLSVDDSVDGDFGVYVSMLCFKCKLQYDFKVICPGVIGLISAKEIKASSWDEFLRSMEDIENKN